MKIASILPCSLVDYPGKVAVVAFTQGCNWCCPYCHNSELISKHRDGKVATRAIVECLESRPKSARNLVITGGEPTIHDDLDAFISELRSVARFIKLDTNGSRPNMLSKLYAKRLIDFVAMDVKATPFRYSDITGKSVRYTEMYESIQLILGSGVPHEFRTTVIDDFHVPNDFAIIGQSVEGARQLVLQPFIPANSIRNSWRNLKPTSNAFLEECAKAAESYLPVILRN